MHNGSGGGKCYQEKQRTGIENVAAALFNKIDRGGLLDCHLSIEKREERREPQRNLGRSLMIETAHAKALRPDHAW